MWNPFRSGPPKPLPPPAPFPWAAAGSACVALLGLYVTVGGVFVPVLVLLTLLPGIVTRVRLDDEPVWLARLGLMGLALAIGLNEPPPDVDGLIDPRVMGLFGQVCAAELVVLLWRRRAPSQGLVGWPTFVFLAASNTFDDRWVRLLAPCYLLLAALALRGWRRRASDTGVSRPARRWGTAARATAFALAIGAGAGLYAGVYIYRGPLNELGMRLLATQKGAGESTGMSAQPQMGATFGLRGSLQRVLRIEGPLGDPHLHGVAYDAYRGGRWFPTVGERKLSPAPDALRLPANAVPTRVIHLTDDGGVLFVPASASGVVGPAPLTWNPSQGGPLQTNAPAPFVSEYAAGEEPGRPPRPPKSGGRNQQTPVPASPVPVGTTRSTASNLELPPPRIGGPGGPSSDAPGVWPAPDAAEHARCLSVPPEIDPRVLALARQITQGQATTAAKSDAVVRSLMARHAYSLTYTPAPGDPVSGFILSSKPAHCEYFAAAATILLREVDTPTRYVTGYYAHESGGAGVTIVRQQDAHAWCEAWDDAARQWTTVDATPGNGRPPATAAPVPPSRRWGEGVSDALAAFRRWVEGLSVRTRWLLIGAMAVSLIIPQIVRARRRRMAGDGPREFAYSPASEAELTDMAGRFERWLAREGFACPPGRPWGEHLRQWEQAENAPPPDALGAAENFVIVYNRLRFGPVADSDDLANARLCLRELEGAAVPQ